MSVKSWTFVKHSERGIYDKYNIGPWETWHGGANVCIEWCMIESINYTRTYYPIEDCGIRE